MGLVLNSLLLIVGLSALGFGFWPVSLVCFVYLGANFWKSTRKKNDGHRGSTAGRNARLTGFVILSALAILAYQSGGTFSPVLFGVLAILILTWKRMPGLG